ncbi:MAG TPA: hypothetical protein VMW52_09930 [Phycisphaerae bacterium]|nr:hypothetical protein [Phycisphaerae bacterium]
MTKKGRNTTTRRSHRQPGDDARTVYAFPTQVRCPRCGALDTTRTGQDGAIQYRACQRGTCRATFKITGKKV